MNFEVTPEIRDLHQRSLEAAHAFAEAYSENAENTLELLEAYRNLRREIPLGTGPNGSRYGSNEAYTVMQSAGAGS